MNALANQSLLNCTQKDTALTHEQAKPYLAQLNAWNIQLVNGEMQIIKKYKFKNYAQAVALTNRVAELAEQENHHPKICLEWGKVTVSWWTHTLGGLFINDFIMAARCDAIK